MKVKTFFIYKARFVALLSNGETPVNLLASGQTPEIMR